MALSEIRWQSAGGYAWTVTDPSGYLSVHYHTDPHSRGVWCDGEQLDDTLNLDGMTHATRRRHVERWHAGGTTRTWQHGGAARTRYVSPRGML